jgi:hypothetical protein
VAKQSVAGDSPSQEEAETIFENFRQVMAVGANDPIAGHGLGLAHTVAHVHLTDADDLTMTLLLDRQPVEAVAGSVGDAEIEIFITSRDIDRFWAGEMHLAMAIAEGEVTYRGPVRKFLRVVPIARRLTPEYLRIRNGGSHES